MTIDEKYALYDEAYDSFISGGVVPEAISGDDPLWTYIRNAIECNPQLTEGDATWGEVVKEEVMRFVEAVLKAYAEVEQEHERQLRMIVKYEDASVDVKREMWSEIYNTVTQYYAQDEVNIKGYAKQFGGRFRQAVADALTSDWRKANDRLLASRCQEIVERGSKMLHSRLNTWGVSDYESRKKIERVMANSPDMKEIVRLIGREKPADPQQMDEVLTTYKPLLPSARISHTDIESVMQDNDLRSMMPFETAVMADPVTELLFYYRFAHRQLQTFANRPLESGPKKKIVLHREKPRLTAGPIIVALDTSSSMSGRPEYIARSLLMQLLRIARQKKRKCHLITFSVRAKHLDLTSMRHWGDVDTFLGRHFTGGTNGEQMLTESMNLLDTDQMSMADVLIISDFYFDLPLPETLARMQQNQSRGTHFYGIQMGMQDCEYEEVLDQVWRVR